MKKWRRDKSEHALLLELPSYRIPHPRDLLIGLWERAMIFLKRVGGIILALTILLWLLLSFPGAPAGAAGPAIDYSFAGRIGHAMTAVFAPVGFNWQICIALIPGLAAREVVVSSLATVYALSVSDDAAAQALSPLIAQGWSVATALSLLVWFIYAPGCISTLATIKRETGSWQKVAVATVYLFGLAYLASFVTYQVARALGAGWWNAALSCNTGSSSSPWWRVRHSSPVGNSRTRPGGCAARSRFGWYAMVVRHGCGHSAGASRHRRGSPATPAVAATAAIPTDLSAGVRQMRKRRPTG
jgi:hypothetical protein